MTVKVIVGQIMSNQSEKTDFRTVHVSATETETTARLQNFHCLVAPVPELDPGIRVSNFIGLVPVESPAFIRVGLDHRSKLLTRLHLFLP